MRGSLTALPHLRKFIEGEARKYSFNIFINFFLYFIINIVVINLNIQIIY